MEENKLDAIIDFIDKKDKVINNNILIKNNINIFNDENEFERYLREIEKDGYIIIKQAISGQRFLVSLLQDGLDFKNQGGYKQLKKISEIKNIKDQELKIIISNVNESILETNQNIRETNQKSVKYSRTQVIISVIMLLVAITIGIISILTFFNDKK